MPSAVSSPSVSTRSCTPPLATNTPPRVDSPDIFVTASSSPLSSRSPSPVSCLRLPSTPPASGPPPLPAAPEDLSQCMRTVWMPDAQGVQREFLADMARLAVAYDFCLVVQVSRENSRAHCEAAVQHLSQLTPEQMGRHVMFVEAGDAFTSWGEDNKILTVPNHAGQPTILYPPRLPSDVFDTAQTFARTEDYHPYSTSFQGAVSQRNEGEDAHAFAQRVHMKSRCTTSYLEGGNVLTGEMPDGQPYALVGRDSLLISTFAQRRSHARRYDPKAVASRCRQMEAQGMFSDSLISDTLHKLRRVQSDRTWLEWLTRAGGATVQDTKLFLAELDLTHDVVARDLGLPRDHVFVVSQPDFHIDMHLRPMRAGEVLLNDPRVSTQLLETLSHASGVPRWQHDELMQMLDRAEDEAKDLGPVVDNIAAQLQKAGLRVVRTPGVMESVQRRANFMNGVAGHLNDGRTFYFTNASSLTVLERAIEAFFSDTIGITHVEFVGGAGGGPGQTNAAEESLDQSGGLDCREVHSSAVFALGFGFDVNNAA